MGWTQFLNENIYYIPHMIQDIFLLSIIFNKKSGKYENDISELILTHCAEKSVRKIISGNILCV